jgi:hypothetical protein
MGLAAAWKKMCGDYDLEWSIHDVLLFAEMRILNLEFP